MYKYFAIFVFIILSFTLSIASIYNSGVRYEANIEKAHEASQDVLSAHFNILKEQAQIPDKYIEGLKDVYTSVMNGRYGEDGSKAVFQWIQEQNPQIDSNIYLVIQNQMAAGRKEFSLSQRKKLDICGDYKVKYNSAFSGTILKMFNFPNQNVLDKCKIVLSSDAIKSFETGISEPVKLW